MTNKKKYTIWLFLAHTQKKRNVKHGSKMLDFAKSVCLIPRDKEWTLAGDVLWQNIKKATMAKRDYHQNSERRNGNRG
ncbi:hypothetical protein Anas_12882 [Armadillidium nasatum]|uniref:Uncharacterized protein n=1 Tax=Armadillidium nasatum TaxID=96803 RepID=A0A5N5TAB5_9CRUS|nr:hypothetical protein Anas_12882 [Armadillidium nasatum]